ncbi:uncharacterized protein EI90DRAFT_3159186 [Cantharellus anzutake]|uniref:uncharacterized protein n=1 Tax=Cantharellus anzutake TaxID=1750568 RepID=UPI00190529FC|nr:uncharacterized protein EI90DRAFT_3159186 [Cantharellus anzutake]KAF8315273.1 hypothetical protein EI90DRAFT_3159186 [Cantharellus anzutake]
MIATLPCTLSVSNTFTLKEMCQELDSLRTAVPGSGGVDLPQMLDDIAQLRRQSSDAQTFVKSLFDTDGNYRFKLRDVRQLLKEAQDEIEVLSQDNNNNTSKPKCYTLINCIDNFLEETEVLKVVRDTLETATGELVEQKERTNQLEALNARNPENIQALSENFHSDLKAHNASLASDLTFLNARESETNSIIRSIVVAKDEIREKLAERNPAICHIHTIPTSAPGSQNSELRLLEPYFPSVTFSLPTPKRLSHLRLGHHLQSDSGTFRVRPQPRHLPDKYATPMLPTPDLRSGIPFASLSPEPPVLAPTSDFDPTSAYTHCIG